ncbi:MAG: helix-turn-helix transcriptional regulator [Bacteroidales bacterium]|nr:helix-turn-helix transcriptional regulator [Bacteroidales bacterium]
MKKKILENVRIFREKANFSQEYLAEKMKISQPKYARFERGATKTDLDMLILFCDTIGISLMDLITYPDKYVNIDKISDPEDKVLLSIEIKKDKKDQIMRLVFGDNNLEIFNK